MTDGPSDTPYTARFIGYIRLYRLSIAAPISVAFLLGTTDADVLRPGTVALLWFLGILYHAYGCGLNDLADADIDQGNPGRRHSPLPGNLLTRQEALLATNLAGLGFLMLSLLARNAVPVFFSCAALALLQTWGNLFQKRSRWVPTLVVDWLFIPAAGGPVVVDSWAVGVRPDYAVITTALAFGMQMVLFNVLAGNLKDIEYDTMAGSRTTAIVLGVRASEGVLTVPKRYARYVVLLEALCVVAMVFAAPVSLRPWSIFCFALAATAVAGAAWDLRRMLMTRVAANKGRQLVIICNWLALMALVAARSPAVAGVSILLTLVWVPSVRWLETRPVRGYQPAR